MRRSIQLPEDYEIAYPGLKVGVVEEYIAEDGVYVEDGNLRSIYLGEVERDLNRRIIKVRELKKTRLIEIGDEALGRVSEVAGVYGVIKVEFVNGKNVKSPFTAIVYPTRRLRSEEKQYSVGDVILAYVDSLRNRMVHLSIRGGKYGVILARCGGCGKVLKAIQAVRQGRYLYCPKCKVREQRKISDLYGSLYDLVELVRLV